jgi:hypothetical protein
LLLADGNGFLLAGPWVQRLGLRETDPFVVGVFLIQDNFAGNLRTEDWGENDLVRGGQVESIYVACLEQSNWSEPSFLVQFTSRRLVRFFTWLYSSLHHLPSVWNNTM